MAQVAQTITGRTVGLRAVLWQQGEGDVTYQFPQETNGVPSDYYSQVLADIILQSRNDSQTSDVPWLISKVAFTIPQWVGGGPPPNQIQWLMEGTVPTLENFNLMREQQDRLANDMVVGREGQLAPIYPGIDSDALLSIDQNGDFTYLYRSALSMPHFNEYGQERLGVAWQTAVMTVFSP